MRMTESKEDYLEAIYIVCKVKGAARNASVADVLNVRGSSASVAIRQLVEHGYVLRDQYDLISLTEKGKEIAERIYARHCFFRAYLISIGVSEETAEQDACRMEHALSEESFMKLQEAWK